MRGPVPVPILVVVLGCTDLEPTEPLDHLGGPPETPCSRVTGAGDCPEQRACSNGVCTDELRPWCDCGAELGCVGGDCVVIDAGNQCTPERPWGACPGGEVCVAGHCVPISADNACSAGMPFGLCPAGAACAGGVCVPIATRACSDSEPSGLCSPGLRCEEGRCVVEPCSAGAPAGACGAAEMCAAGTCQSLPCGLLHLDGACDAGQTCSSIGACIDAGTCAVDADCGAGRHCVSGDVCLPAGECLLDADCSAEQICAAAGLCVDAVGGCADQRDCEVDQYCNLLGHCLDAGTCEASLDCPPAHTCVANECQTTAVSCTTNQTTTQGCNDYEIDCCPPGEECCPGRDRCAATGTCIHHSQCLEDRDCLAGFSCVYFSCQPLEPCDCESGERCSVTGGCIPEDQCADDLDCPSDAICTPEYRCRVDPGAACAGCFGSVSHAAASFPGVLFVVDRSSAMNACAVDGTWWTTVREGFDPVTEAYSDLLHLGLSTFPAACPEAACDPECGADYCDHDCPVGSGVPNDAAGGADVPVAATNGAPIRDRLAAVCPGGERALGATLRAIAAAPFDFGVASADRDNVIVIVTSGPPGPDEADVDGCAAEDAACKLAAAIDDLAALEPPVATHVLELGDEALVDGDALAETVRDLLREMVPCTFALPDPSAAGWHVYADDGATLTSIPMGGEDGWAFGDSFETIVLHGEACDRVRSGQTSPVLIGCHLCE